ncbi:MAG: signal peptidase I [Candidatus Acidiferrales bacterium]
MAGNIEPSPPAHRGRHVTHARGTAREYLETLVVTVILALFATTFIVQAFKIPTRSMEPTLLVGDHLLVDKFIFGGRGHWYDRLLPYREVRRGDVIVFPYPYGDHPYYVKRAIGLPGDRLKIVNQTVYINGAPLKENYAFHDPRLQPDSFGANFPPRDIEDFDPEMRPEWAAQILSFIHNGELVIPPGQYFAMGDNRDNSEDSRYWGFVDREAIIGRPIVIYWSVRSAEADYESRGVVGHLADLLDALIHLPARTRGDRILRLVH